MLTRNEYTDIHSEEPTCNGVTPAIVVEGPGRRGELVHVCVNPECDLHGSHRAERDSQVREREAEWKRRQAEREKNRENNRRLLNSTLQRVPKSLTRADYEMLVLVAIDRIEHGDFDALCERYSIDTDEVHEPDAAAFVLREKIQKATESQLIRMLVELALLPSGYSEERLEPSDELVRAAARYAITTTKKPVRKPKAAKNVVDHKRSSKSTKHKDVRH